MTESILQNAIQEISQTLGNSIKQHNLLGGDLGKILFSSYYYLKNKNEDTNVFQLIENAFESDEIQFIDELGSVWLIQHLINIGILDKDSSETVEDLINNVPTLIEEDRIKKNHELLYGVMGKALLYLEAYPQFEAKKHLSKIVADIKETAYKTPNGLTWVDIKKEEETSFNLGLSHGMPAVIVGLSKIYTAIGEGKETLEKAVEWLLAQKIEKGLLNDYPSITAESFTEQEKRNTTRLAWCYGDLGVALALFHASKALNREDWKQEAINTALKATKRTPENATIFYGKELGIFDAGICHGTAGVAHIFNRFYKATKIQDFKVAANFWLQKTLDTRLSDGIWLFPRHNQETNEKDWAESNSFLEGLIGVGLVLLAFQDENTDPAWDKYFMMDI